MENMMHGTHQLPLFPRPNMDKPTPQPTTTTVCRRIAYYVRGQGGLENISVEDLIIGMCATQEERRLVRRCLNSHRPHIHHIAGEDMYEYPVFKDGRLTVKRKTA